jgi:regulator of replication initiation timing
MSEETNTAVAEPEVTEASPEVKSPEVDYIDEIHNLMKAEAEPTAEAEPAAAENVAVAEPEPAAEPEKKSRSADDFKLLKTQRDTAKSELENLRAEVSDLKKQAESSDADSLRLERDDLSSRLKAASIERHPEFRKFYTQKLDGVIARAKSTAGEHGDRMEQILKMDNSAYRDQQMEELFSELPASKQATLGALIAQSDEVRAEKQSRLEDADSTYEQLMSSQSTQQAQVIEQSRKTFEAVSERASTLEVYQKREGDDDWNAEVDARRDMARNAFLGQSSEEELAMIALWGPAGEKYRELLGVQIELNRRLQEQLDGLQGATPSVSTSSSKQPPAEKDFIAEVNELMKG